MYSKIVVPVDLAEAELAGRAINAAAIYARESGGQIRLVYVRPFVPMPYMEWAPADFDKQQQEEAEKELAKLAATVTLPKEKISTKVLMGSISGAVLDEADDWGGDLIVVWSHRPGISSYLIGSNAATMVRHAKMSVLVVR